MENEVISPLEREDRESVFDDLVFSDQSLERIDYATYLKNQRGEQTVEDWKKQSSQNTQEEVSKPAKFDAFSKSRILQKEQKTKKEDKEGKRVKKVTLVTSEEVWRLLKIVAASEGKTVSTYLNDFILDSLKEKLKQADRYNKMSTEINDSD